MPEVKKHKSKLQIRSLFDKPVWGRIDENMPDFDNDPAVVEKCEKAAAFFNEHPEVIEFIKELQEKNK